MDIKRLGLLLRPSQLSIIGNLMASGLILAVASLSYLAGSGLIYNFLFGSGSSIELIQTSRGTFSAFNNTVFGNPTLNKVLYFAMWMLIGLCVYLILYSLGRGAVNAAKEVEEAGYTNINKKDQLKNFGSRAAARLASLIAWFIYCAFFVKVLLPFSILSVRIGAGNIPALDGWFYGLLGLAVLVLSLHIHLVFARLIALRVRIFHTDDEGSLA